MIKMIVTDIDGTIVKDASTEVFPEFIDTVEKLMEAGVLFVVASGRAYSSISHMFRRIEDKIAVIAENGAHILYRGKELSATAMQREYAEDIVKELRKYTASGIGELLVSTEHGSFIEGENQTFIDFIKNNYRNQITLTKDILKENTPIMKISFFQEGSAREIGENDLIPKWNDKVQVCMAGEEWVDFMDASVDKGHALQFLMDYFKVQSNEILAFGDNSNDIGMLKKAGKSYAVENAREEVKSSAGDVCPSYKHRGVYHILLNQLGGM